MKHIKKFDNFSINEALGIATATLLYSDFILEETKKHFDIFIKSGEKKYNKVESYKLDESITSNQEWVKMPVSNMRLNFIFVKKTDDVFAKDYPVSSKIKNFTTTGACYNITEKKVDEEDSYLTEPIDDRTDHSIFLSLEAGAVICDKFNEYDDLYLEIESAIIHELNHGYEGYKRMMSGSGQVSVDVTWALDANRSRIKKEIWKKWGEKIGYGIYYSERHELNAMAQEALPYVKKYDIDELMVKSPSWRNADDLEKFNAVEFKKEISELINKFYPDIDPTLILNRMKNGFANQLDISRKESVERVEDAPSISGRDIRKMDIDKFLLFIQTRLNKAGKELKRRIIRLYSLKNEKH
jgi:hypothetical protein